MNESDALALTVLVAIIGLALAVLWVLLAFAVFDIKRTNRELVKALTTPHTPPPVP